MGKVNVLGVLIDQLRLTDVYEFIDQVIATDRRAIITYVNVMGVNLAYEHEWFRQFINKSDLAYCDGGGVRLGARFLGYHLPERFTLADWMESLAGIAEARGHSLFFLGNPPGVPEAAAERLCMKFPGLKIAGVHHGFFDKSPGHKENEAVIQQINTAKPNILFVGFGMPVQEKWIQENWAQCEGNIAFAVGAAFEYVAGILPRGPRWMTDHNLEWLARMIISPRRYTRRYLHDNPLFFYRLLRQRISGYYPSIED